VRRAAAGQTALEFALLCGVLAAALFVPWNGTDSVSTLLARLLVAAFHGVFTLIAYA
jgi:hypothetical protein